MNEIFSKASQKVLSVFLSLAMVLSLVPANFIVAKTTEVEQQPNKVTFIVKDSKGNAIEGATVELAEKETSSKKEASQPNPDNKPGTDTNTEVDLNPEGNQPVNPKPIEIEGLKDEDVLKISAKGYVTHFAKLNELTVNKGTNNKEVTLYTQEELKKDKNLGIPNVYINNVVTTYNKKLQTLVKLYKDDTYTGQFKYTVKEVSNLTKGKGEKELNNVVDDTRLKKTDANKYSWTITVKDKNKSNRVFEVNSEIKKAKATGVSLTAEERTYTGEDLALVSLNLGDFKDDTKTKIEWKVNDKVATLKDGLPVAKNAGEYEVKLTITSNNYEDYTPSTVKAKISKKQSNEVEVEGIEVPENLVYTGKEQALLKFKEGVEQDKYQFKVDKEVEWLKDIPKRTNAGTYTVYVKWEDENKIKTASYTVEIKKATQTITFKNSEYNTDKITLNINIIDPYDFDINPTETNNSADYSLDITEDFSITIFGNQTYLLKNKLYLLSYGTYTLTVKVKGNDNYQDTERLITITTDDSQADFEQKDITVVLGKTSKEMDPTILAKNNDGHNQTKYQFEDEKIDYLSVDENGVVRIVNLKKLLIAMEESRKNSINNNDELLVVVKGVRKDYEKSYNLHIKFAAVPTDAITVSTTNLSSTTGKKWCQSATVTEKLPSVPAGDPNAQAQSKYMLAYAPADFGAFGDKAEIKETVEQPYVYLRNRVDGTISSIQLTDVNVDTTLPTVFEVQAVSPTKILESVMSLGKEVTLKITASDEHSGIEKITYRYVKESEKGVEESSTTDQTLTNIKSDGKSVSGEVTFKDKNYEGKLIVTATDNVKNKNTQEDSQKFIVDNEKPIVEFGYQGTEYKNNNYRYYDNKVELTVKVTENYFNTDDFEYTLYKDGKPLYLDEKETSKFVTIKTVNNVTTVTFTFKDEGTYQLKDVKHVDEAGNSSDEQGDGISSDFIVIDKTAPKLESSYEDNTLTLTVTETNFDVNDIDLSDSSIKNINDVDTKKLTELTNAIKNIDNWKTDGNKYTFTQTLDNTWNGIYELNLKYTDKVNHEVTYELPFTHDQEKPSNVNITIETQANKETDDALYYRDSIQLTLSANDCYSGVDKFKLSYTKDETASKVDHESEKTIEIDAIKDETDQSLFTAEITLDAKNYAQLNGQLSLIAIDAKANESDEFTNSKKVVLDTKSPELSDIEYTKADHSVKDKHYYNNAIDVKFNVTEANFFQDIMQIKVTKDGNLIDTPIINWTDKDDKDVVTGSFTLDAPEDHTADGDYVITINATDYAGNKIEEYKSETLTIDTTNPVIDVTYGNTKEINNLKDAEKHDRSYFDDLQTATIRITERNFDFEDVNFDIVAKDVTGKELDVDSIVSKANWVDQENYEHVIVINYTGDANYTFDVNYTDLATNKAADYAEDYFTVDKTRPTNPKVEYSTSVLDTILHSITFGFYNAKMKVTLSSDDATSGVHSFLYSYLNAKGVSPLNAQLINQKVNEAKIKYSNGGKTGSITFEIPKLVLNKNDQFNGTVEFTSNDRAENVSKLNKETKRIVVDNIAPTANVSFNKPTNVVGNIAYYNGNINATVNVNEANFYANDVKVSVTKDGKAIAVKPNWSSKNTDNHVGTFTLKGDGDYVVSIQYRDKSNNVMKSYKSRQMTIDTNIKKPTYSINGSAKKDFGGSYKKDVTVGFNYGDRNFASKNIKLTRTRFNKVEDVTAKYIKVNGNRRGGSGSFKIPAKAENDGIYQLTISMSDKAKHTTKSSMKFTINRFGSVYEYDQNLVSLIKNGGQFVKEVKNDLTITEYNAGNILDNSAKIMITRDGEPMKAQYTIRKNKTNSDGWTQYTYRISKDNFIEDGVYKISVASKYAVDDSKNNNSSSVPENSMDFKGKKVVDTMNFTVDTKAPEIRNIVNLEKPIINAQKVNVKYTIIDVGGLKSIEAIVNGKTIDKVTDFDHNAFNYNGEFTLNEMSDTQTIQLKVTDLAGNVVDTNSDKFTTGDLYEFNNKVTVSTNMFVRWYANKALFFGSIIGVVAVLGGIYFFFIKKRKNDEESDQ